jgi:hypothetical protein
MILAEEKKNQEQIDKEKYESIMSTIARRAGYYRANPHRFVKDYLCITLKLFQKILIWAMMYSNYFLMIACRGIGKSFLVALFCCVRAILYPGSKIVVVSGTLKQANEVLLKIQNELMKMSPMLCNEIDIKKMKIGQNDAIIPFKNGSWIRTTTSTDNSRGQRSNVIIVDEFRMVDEDVLNKVIRKFNVAPRQPKYLSKPEYAHMQERNKELYLSSAYFKSSWSWHKVQSYVANFLNDQKKYFVCGLPYQLAIKEGILMREQVEDEMSESDFNELAFTMEMEAMWIGDEEGSLFSFDDLSKSRKIKTAFMPLKFYNDKNPVPKLLSAEKRILSVDIALMQTTKRKKNDATAVFINSLIQTSDTQYQSNIVYAETVEGMRADDLAITIMRYFYKYNCTDLVIDGSGVGQPIVDLIMKDQYDPLTGETYKAFTCINNKDIADRCNVKDANKCMWVVKGDASFNDEVATLLRSGFQNGNISMLENEEVADEVLSEKIKSYNKMTLSDKLALQNPYLQITMTVFELIKLDHEVKSGKIKVKEQSNMRKDRYSSLAYNYWCARELERQLKPKNQNTEDLIKAFSIRKAKHF